ncbi:MAG TPA: tetratricopeptide repeat protein, partial [Thermoanaerobaculia bacterium]
MASKRDSLIASAEKSLAKGRIEPALSDYMKVLDEVPGDIGILNKVGDLLVRLSRNEESIPYFIRIAEHYAHDGFYVKAIAMYKKVNRLDPARLEIYERLAELYSKQGLAMEAKSQYQVLADHYLKQDNSGGAIAIFQKMIQADPANIQLHVKLADLFTQVRRVPEALKEYAIVAGMLRDRSAHAEAVQVYEKALKLAPDNVEILRSLVPLLIETGNAAGARVVLRRALETTPRSVPLFVMAAEAALSASDLADARNWATKAQAVDPENEEVLNAVVKVHMKARRPDLAVPAAASLADLCVRRGEVKKALGILVPIAKVAPESGDLLRKIVDISMKSGDEAFAVPYRSAIAEICRREGRSAEAAEQLRICSRLAPDNAEFRARLSALEPLLASPAAGAPASRGEIPEHDRAMTIPGDMLSVEMAGSPSPPPPVAE